MKQARFPIFKDNLNKLMQDEQMNTTEFADKLGLSRQTVGFYLNGDRIPDALTLRSICERCSVSADYLLGLAEEQTPDQSIQAVCRYTGLSEKAIDSLCHYGEIKLQDGYHDITHGIGKQLLNLLIESDNFFAIMTLLRQCVAAYAVKNNRISLFTGGDYMDAERIVTDAGQVILKSSEAAAFYANTAADYLKQFAKEELRPFADQICTE